MLMDAASLIRWLCLGGTLQGVEPQSVLAQVGVTPNANNFKLIQAVSVVPVALMSSSIHKRQLFQAKTDPSC